MSRQCLYCNKELSKSSASNFCSKECWTEYKKLKAMNIDADKQATVLLKRSDIPSAPEMEPPASSEFEIPSDYETEAILTESEQAESMETAEEESGEFLVQDEKQLDTKISEDIFNTKINELTDAMKKLDDRMQSIDPSDTNTSLEDIIHRITKLEQEFEGIEQLFRSASKFEERLISLEKRLRSINIEKPEKKKGFFARLFG